MRCTRSRACVRVFLLASLSSRLGDRGRYHASRNRNAMKSVSPLSCWISVVVAFILGVSATLGSMALGLFQPPSTSVAERAKWGEFTTTPKLELAPDGREASVIEDFAYVDPRGKVWIAPKGSIVNGASIPKPFWSIVGGPLDGQYRNASIIHDVACERIVEKWEDVHVNFYEACRCGGVPESKAKMLFGAVYHFCLLYTSPSPRDRG